MGAFPHPLTHQHPECSSRQKTRRTGFSPAQSEGQLPPGTQMVGGWGGPVWRPSHVLAREMAAGHATVPARVQALSCTWVGAGARAAPGPVSAAM